MKDAWADSGGAWDHQKISAGLLLMIREIRNRSDKGC